MPVKEHPSPHQKPVGSEATYRAQDYSRLFGMSGFSDKLLQTHFKLYEGYVAQANQLNEKLRQLIEQGQGKTPEFAEMKRRWGWEWNGMRLHECYFGNLVARKGGESSDIPAALKSRIAEQFGSLDNWKNDFLASGAMRGIGWVILYEDTNQGWLFNSWIEEHATNHLAGGYPLLVMDVFEHAYMPDYGTDRANYIESFFKNIDWDVVAYRTTNRRTQQ